MEQICYYLVNINQVAILSRTSQNRPSHPRLRTTDLEIGVLRCIFCEGECTGAHRCPDCHRAIHTICGQTVDGMEGYGCGAWCISCWLDYRADGVRQVRLTAKKGQEKTDPTNDKPVQQKD